MFSTLPLCTPSSFVNQERIHSELVGVCGDAAPGLADVPSLPLLQAAVAEAQRMRPVVPVGLPRGCARDTILAGYRVPKGAMLVPLQWAVHTDPRLWQRPETYMPDRFLNAEGRFVTPQAFIPFQAGEGVSYTYIRELRGLEAVWLLHYRNGRLS